MHRDAAAIEALFALPFNDLIYRAQTVHRRHFDPNAVQLSTLLSIKTGGCSEDCGYCSQVGALSHRPIENQPLMPLDEAIGAPKPARQGEGRDTLSAWARPGADRKKKGFRAGDGDGPRREGARDGNLRDARPVGSEGQAEQHAAAGTWITTTTTSTPRAHYDQVVHTHTYDDRLERSPKCGRPA